MAVFLPFRKPKAGAFEEALRRYQDMVFGIAWHSLRDAGRAEEIAQDVFLRLYQDWDRMESDDHVRFWLRRTTASRCIDEARRRKFTRGPSLDEVSEPAFWPAESDPALRRIVWDAVDRLPGQARTMLVLRYQEDLEPVEIARILKVPAATVKSRLFRALQAVRGRLQKAGVLAGKEA
jgi:RNA polymerase sigma-70 factor (ECF subfamily)